MGGRLAIEIRGLNHTFGTGALRKQLLFDINLEVRAGEIVILTGPSGSGKTTLLTLCGALRSVQEGSVAVLGRQLLGADREQLNLIRERMGFIFQKHHLLGALTARQNVALSLGLDRTLTARQRSARAAAMLEAVGLGDCLDFYPDRLSGGQQQRVAVARALARNPELVLADEPTASLDRQSGREVIDLLLRLARKQRCSILLVTHDPRILDIADRTVHLEDGRLQGQSQPAGSTSESVLARLLTIHREGKLLQETAGLSPARILDLLDHLAPELAACLQLANTGSHDEAHALVWELSDSTCATIAASIRAAGYRLSIANGPEPMLNPTQWHMIESPLPQRNGAVIGWARFHKPATEPGFTVEDTAILHSSASRLGLLMEARLAFAIHARRAGR